MLWAAIFQAIAKGITNAFSTWNYMKEQKTQAKEVAEQTQEQANERAKKAKLAMQEQKSSFLKSGVYFDSGTPINVLNETYKTMQDDIKAMNKDSVKQQQRFLRSGRTAFWTFMIDPLGNDGSGYANNIYQAVQNRKSQRTFNTTDDTIKMSGSPASSKMTNEKLV